MITGAVPKRRFQESNYVWHAQSLNQDIDLTRSFGIVKGPAATTHT